MFRAAHGSSLGSLNCICSFWFIYPCGDRPLSRLSGNGVVALSVVVVSLNVYVVGR